MKKITKLIPLFLLVVATPLTSCTLIRRRESVKAYKRSYSFNETNIARQNTFRELNTVNYPQGSGPTRSELSENERQAYSNFSNETYHALVNTSKKDNFSYATIGLFTLMNEMYGAISRDALKTQFDALLGLDDVTREDFYKKVMKANSYANEDNTTQLKNAAFFNSEYNFNQEFVNILTKLYCEAYQLNFKTDANKMVEWVNKAVNADNFIDTNFLELTDDSLLYFFSTLYFKNMWSNKYLAENNVTEDFYLSNGNKIQTEFMKHSYMAEGYYDYDKYISFKDYYGASNSITYLIPKSTDDNIFELTKNVNIFEENPEKAVKSEDEYNNYWLTVNLKTPKFKLKTDVDFKTSLASLGFIDMFNESIDSFKNAFNDNSLSVYNVFISVMKQRNEVEFNEDGTIVKSVSMSGFAKGESAPFISNDTLDVNLNQPFIYIIRDINNIPIFVGHVDNPKVN